MLFPPGSGAYPISIQIREGEEKQKDICASPYFFFLCFLAFPLLSRKFAKPSAFLNKFLASFSARFNSSFCFFLISDSIFKARFFTSASFASRFFCNSLLTKEKADEVA